MLDTVRNLNIEEEKSRFDASLRDAVRHATRFAVRVNGCVVGGEHVCVHVNEDVCMCEVSWVTM